MTLNTNEALFAFVIKNLLFFFCLFSSLLRSWQGDVNEKQHKQAHMLQICLNTVKAQGQIFEMKLGLLLFISKLKNR